MSVKCLSIVWELQIRSSAKKLLLLALADNANDQGECWPGLERIRKKVGLKTIRAVQLSINKLVKEGLIKSEDRHRKDGRQTTNLYCLNLDKFEQIIAQDTLNVCSSSPRTNVHPHPEQTFTGTPPKNTKKEIKNNILQGAQNRELSRLTKNITKSSCASDDARAHLFEELWKIYPKKKDKKRAKEKYIKIPSDQLPLILEKVKYQIQFDQQWKEIKYIPELKNYLHNERWKDEIVISAPNKSIQEKPKLNEPKCTVPDYGPGHPRWEALHGSEAKRDNARGNGVRQAQEYIF